MPALTHPALTHLAIMDWGIGGLDLYTRITRLRPHLTVTYVSDSGFTPYGKVDAPTLAARVQALVEWFEARGAELVLVACNAASTVLPLLPGAHIPTLGVIEPTLTHVRQRPPTNVVVLGGQRTIDSGAYTTALLHAGIPTWAVVAQPLSALIEAGKLTGTELEQTLTEIWRGVELLEPVDTLVPACTHYVAVLPKLLQFFNPRQVVDPAAITLIHLLQHWNVTRAPTDERCARHVLTTGSAPGMASAARQAFGIELPHIQMLHTDLSPGD